MDLISQFKISQEKELENIARYLIDTFNENRIFAFYGTLGAGKTTLIKYICQILGVKENTSSPTFAIINEYRTDKSEKVYHFDFYRIQNTAEAFDIGYEDYFYSNNYCFIEWADRIEELLPADCVKIVIEADNSEARTISVYK